MVLLLIISFFSAFLLHLLYLGPLIKYIFFCCLDCQENTTCAPRGVWLSPLCMDDLLLGVQMKKEKRDNRTLRVYLATALDILLVMVVLHY